MAGWHSVSTSAARAGRPARKPSGWCGQTLPLAPMELAFDIAPNSTLGLDFAGALQLTVNRDGLRLSRRGLQTAEMHHRYWRGEARRLRILSTAPAWRFSSTMARVMSSRSSRAIRGSSSSAVRRRWHSAAGCCGHAW